MCKVEDKKNKIIMFCVWNTTESQTKKKNTKQGEKTARIKTCSLQHEILMTVMCNLTLYTVALEGQVILATVFLHLAS